MKIDFKKGICIFITLYILGLITINRYPTGLPDNTSFTDIANIAIALIAVATLVWTGLTHIQTEKNKESLIALNSFIETIDHLIGQISDKDGNLDRKYFFIQSAHKALLESEHYIKSEAHKEFASRKFEILQTHLKLMYFKLDYQDFLNVPDEIKDDYSLQPSAKRFEHCAVLLTGKWLKHVAPNTYFLKNNGWVTYGSEGCTDVKYLFPFISLLVSKPSNILPTTDVKKNILTLAESNIIEDCGYLETLVTEYPILLAHILLSKSLSAHKDTNSISGYLPKIKVYGPKSSWFVINRYATANILKIHDRVNLPRYIVRTINDEKLPNPKPIHVIH